MMASPYHLLLGLGYGVPLTDFYGHTGVQVREPHNSYISIVARTGIVGAIAWIAMMVLMLRAWRRAFRHTVEVGWREGQNRLMLLMVFFISMWVLAIGEDGFEKPYNIIPFYFFWGIVLRMGLLLERGEIGPEDDGEEEPPAQPYLTQPLSLRPR
jgi:O-antigen ligase